MQLAFVCQQVMLGVQYRLRLTMQHVHGHTGNLGNECVDHAAALGTFGLVSSHNLATRWARHNFDTSACFGSCNNIGEVLENYATLELKQRRYLATGVRAVFFIGPSDFHARIASYVVCSQSFFFSQPFTVPCCTFSEPWKALHRVFLPLRALMKASNTTCGIT